MLDTHEAINRLGNLAKVTLVWTKAHVGNTGNKRADTLAKEGPCSDSHPDVVEYYPRSYEENLIKDMIREEWTREWKEHPQARQTKHFFPELLPRNSKEIIGLSRRGVGHIVRLVTGHNNLNYPSHLRDSWTGL